MKALTPRQEHALRMIAELRSGVAINGNTAAALERRGLATITGGATMNSGYTMRLTEAGRVEAIAAWRRYDDYFQSVRGKPSDIAAEVIAKLEAQAPPRESDIARAELEDRKVRMRADQT